MSNVKILRLRQEAHLPSRGSAAATGFDLYACLDESVVLTGQPQLIPCGIAIASPEDIDTQIRPRSGLTLKGVVAPFGTIDADYRGELFVTMYVLPGCDEHVVHSGDRIAQLVFSTLPRVVTTEVFDQSELSSTARGSGGHGSTGDR